MHHNAMKLLDGLSHVLALTSYSLELVTDVLGAPDAQPRVEAFSGAVRKKSVCPYYTPAAGEGIREF